MDIQIKSLAITQNEEVVIGFARVDALAGSIEPEAGDDAEDDDRVKVPKGSFTSPYKPHKDLLDAMAKLRKHAIEILELQLKSTSDWSVTAIKIAGDVTEKKSRVQLRLSKWVKRTKKMVHMGYTPQVTMYPSDEDAVKYSKADELTAAIEEVIDEATQYLDGKYGDDDLTEEQCAQLALFPERELQPA